MTQRAKTKMLKAIDVDTTGVGEAINLGDFLGGLMAHFKLTTLTGGAGPTVDPKLQHSPNGSTWYDLDDTFAAQADTVSPEEKSVVGPTFAWVRWSWTTTGGPTTALAEMAIHAGLGT